MYERVIRRHGKLESKPYTYGGAGVTEIERFIRHEATTA